MNTNAHSSVRIAAAASLLCILAGPVAMAEADTQPATALGTESHAAWTLWQDTAGGSADDSSIAVDQPPDDLGVSATLGALYQIGADIDGGNNDVSVRRVATALSFDVTLNEANTLAFTLGYGVSSYDFAGTTGFFAGDPWDDIHTFTAGVLLQTKISDDWTLFGGPALQVARESGADFNDGFTGGAVIGASWKISDRLVLGGGLGVMSQIDDDARVFPVLRFHWQISDRWSLSSNATGQLITPTMVQLGYQITDWLHLGLGGGYHFRRFALDDSGPAASGVGEDEAFALNIAARWTPCATFTLTGLIGTTFGGQLTAESATGALLSEQDVDGALFFGAVGTIRF